MSSFSNVHNSKMTKLSFVMTMFSISMFFFISVEDEFRFWIWDYVMPHPEILGTRINKRQYIFFLFFKNKHGLKYIYIWSIIRSQQKTWLHNPGNQWISKYHYLLTGPKPTMKVYANEKPKISNFLGPREGRIIRGYPKHPLTLNKMVYRYLLFSQAGFCK